MPLILIPLILFLVWTTEVTANTFEDLFKKEPSFCAIDTVKDNQNDPCSPDNTASPEPQKINNKQKDKKKVLINSTPPTSGKVSSATTKTTVVFFWAEGCPHCAKQKPFLQSLKGRFPEMEVKSYEVSKSRENIELFQKIANAYGIKATGVPATFIGERAIVGFSDEIAKDIEEALKECRLKTCIDPLQREASVIKKDTVGQTQPSTLIDIPFLGKTDVSNLALPVMTVVIAGLDSFNPCAFFVLFSLLGLMIHARSKKKMALVGGVFVFFSGFMYFLFMAAWLNFFLIMGEIALITVIAGLVAIVIGVINIKDFFAFKEGLSLTLSDEAKTKLFDRMRRLLRSSSLVSTLFATVVLAIVANAYELICTAGFPMVFTRILTLHNLPTLQYYLYLFLYNLVYVVPLATIVVVFTVSLGKRQLTESQGRFLKLLSGLMMMDLGIVLLIKPSLLNNVAISVLLLLSSLVVSLILHRVYRPKSV